MSNDMHALAGTMATETDFIDRIVSGQRQEQEERKRVSRKMAELSKHLKFAPGDKVFHRRHQAGQQRGIVTGVSFRAFVPMSDTEHPLYEVYLCGDLGFFSEDTLTLAPHGPEPDEVEFQLGAEVVVESHKPYSLTGETYKRTGNVIAFRYEYEYGFWEYLVDFGTVPPEWWDSGQMEVATNA